MSNAGKVLLGADGNPLIGHDGKVVLADDLYKMRATATGPTEYVRRTSYYDATPPCAINDVWDETWRSPTGTEGGAASVLYVDASPGNDAIQSVDVYGFENANIDFDRVASLTVRVRVRSYLGNPSLYPGNGNGAVYIGIAASAPSGDAAPWEDGGSLADGWSSLTTIDFSAQTTQEEYEYHDVTVPVVSGVPQTLSIAAAFEPFGCGDDVSQILQPTITQVSVVYNLAAA
jgi:hypothetical protein